ncbi:hypothetical protein AB4851_22375 [Burkholderia sp. 22PA0099]|uniref:hypothetical protein n=1 Tax=Burkholderia sp. 22PA0099 TaxID=3237372 RepID=UPI0039C31E85
MMNDPKRELAHRVIRHAECYWKSWGGDSEAVKVGRIFESVDHEVAIGVLVELFLRIGGWGRDALKMECCRCLPEVPTKSNERCVTVPTNLSLVEIGNRCFHGVTSIRESRAEITEFVKSHEPEEIVAGVAALMLDIKFKGREALRRSCGMARC